MGKPSSQTSTSQSGPPPQVLANYQNVFNQSQNVASQPYPTYGGGLLAGFTPQQTAGFNNINTAVNSSQPFINAASQDATNATSLLDPSNAIGTIGGYMNPNLQAYLNGTGTTLQGALTTTNNASSGLNAQNFGSTVGNYYSPYAQSVIAPTEAQFNSQNAQQLNQVRGNAAAQGAFGGDREAVAEAQTAGQQQLAEAPVIAGLESQGYNQATTNAMQAAGLQQQTAGLQEQAANTELQTGNTAQNEFATALGGAQGNAWLNSQGSFALGNLGNEAETLGLTGANAEIGAGAQQQQLGQQELNAPYQQFLTAQGFPYQLTNYDESMATGLGSLMGQNSSQTSPGPSGVSQVAGLGLTGLGLAGALGWAPFARDGGRIDRLGAIRSLRRDITLPRRDVGGAVSPTANPAAPLGSPMQSGLYQQYATMPTEKLQELAVQMPQNPMVQRAVQMRRMQPQSDPSMQQQMQAGLGSGTPGQTAQPQQMMAAPGGFAEGGEIERDDGGYVPDGSLPMQIPTVDPSGPIQQPMGAMGGNLPMQDPSNHQMHMRPQHMGNNALRIAQMGMGMMNGAPPGGNGGNSPFNSMIAGLGMLNGNQPYAAGGAVQRDAGGGISDSGPNYIGMSDLPFAYGMPSSNPAPAPSMEPITSQNTGSWQDDAPALGMSGIGSNPPPPSPVGGAYADFRPAAGFGPQDSPRPSTGIPAPQHHMVQAHHPQPPPASGLGPQQAPPAAPPTGAMGGDTALDAQSGTDASTHSHPHLNGNFLATPSGMLLAAGLGILGGKSPFASVNIGQGGLEGLQLGEQAAQRQTQMDYNNQYRQEMLGLRGRTADISQQRADTNDRRADTGELAQQARQRAQELQGQVSLGRLSLSQAQAQFNNEYKGLNFDFQQNKAGVASAQRARALDQADTRIVNSQANAQAAQAIRRQALQQTKDAGEQRQIQTATNSDIHAAASLAGSLGIPYGKALAQIQAGRGSAEAGNGVAPGTTTGAAPDQQRPPLQSIFGQ